jgi:hypothetical protein
VDPDKIASSPKATQENICLGGSWQWAKEIAKKDFTEAEIVKMLVYHDYTQIDVWG